MTGTILAAAESGTGEAITFWVLAPLAVLAALGMILSRNAVHAALFLVFDFLAFAVFYALQEAPFLALVQVIVYTGAIMILFLFVLMLIGVDSSDSLVEVIRGQRIAAVFVGLGFAGLLVAALGNAMSDTEPQGLAAANEQGNVRAIAALLFKDYVLAFEVTSALLITAALGAMVLAHRERLGPAPSQALTSRNRFRPGGQFSPLPGPGVYARHDAVDSPAMLPDGSTAPGSVSPAVQGLREDDGTPIADAHSPVPGGDNPAVIR